MQHCYFFYSWFCLYSISEGINYVFENIYSTYNISKEIGSDDYFSGRIEFA
jgi:hypothetical protein